MHGPASSGWLLVALCAATGAYCLLRMRSGVEEQRRAAGDEALMGFGMAVMAVPAAVFSPPWWAWPGYAVVFGVAGLRALWAARTDPHHLHHLVGAAAMVYMAAVMAGSPGGAHTHPGAGVPPLTGALLLYFVGYVLLSGFRLVPVTTGTGRAAPGEAVAGGTVARGTIAGGALGATGTAGRAVAGRAGWGDRPELARVCRLSMGIATLTMLLTL
ncbi:DUF5134 domain-containing protein [Streptomyces sp. DH24]|uniref:DUF5134 domain-containing protein n=1 Tax=Streptomyces sp. DH24 TaxID=3040123 RepID=UPI002441654C|nr:DUF5134 domain-containing protein [Streptomyces sp. DH24]MDG9718314.1 DUF5134 domain-containing protein [Streptomyces sp. DH24]